MKDAHKEWGCRAITPIWTGDADRKGDRYLISSGLLGSVRWWFEVLVRGLGGSACDPSNSQNRCPDKKGNRCLVCELFGCTGWGRKFRLELANDNGPIQEAILENTEFTFQFIPLRPIREEEWALLDLTFKLIADYGAIGGRTVFKPSDEPGREKKTHHKDYGLIELLSRPSVEVQEGRLRSYVKQSNWRNVNHGEFSWASLDNFWCVNGFYLARHDKNKSDFNKVLGRDERKTCRDCGHVHEPRDRCPKTNRYPKRYSERFISRNPTDQWIAGDKQESKKVFSFKQPPRTFGFVKPDVIEFDEMMLRLSLTWPKLKADEYLRGPEILRKTIRSFGGSP